MAVSLEVESHHHQQEQVDEQRYRLHVHETLPLHAVSNEQLITLNSEVVTNNEAEENKRIRKREMEHLKYLRKKERLAEKKASMSEEQKLELLEKQRQVKKKYYAQKKAKLNAYEQLLKEGEVEKIEMDHSKSAGTTEAKNDDTDLLLLPKKRQRNTQEQSVITEEQKKEINFAEASAKRSA